MKSEKRKKMAAEKSHRKRTAAYKSGKGNSRYALKIKARNDGKYSATSPLRFGPLVEVS